MTQGFKYGALEYVTGSLFKTDTNNRGFIDCKTTPNNITTKLQEKGITPASMLGLTVESTSNYLIYGTYIENSEQYGYMVVLDQNGTVIKILTTYDTGTKLSPILTLNSDENGIYGIDLTNGKYRIILLNNVPLESAKGYFCKLRASYYVNLNFDIFDTQNGTSPIKKVPGEPIYYLFGYANNKATIIKFVNNVGIPNEWYQAFGHSIGNDVVLFSDFIFETVGDTTSVYIYYVLNADKTKLHYEVFNGENLTNYKQTEINTPVFDIAMYGKESVYYATRSSEYVYVWNYSNREENQILEAIMDGSSIRPSLLYKDGILFIKIESFDSTNKYLLCITYDKNGLNYSDMYTGDASDYKVSNCVVQKTFSLYRFMVQGVNTVMQPSVVIYDNMYSGTPYFDYGVASAQKGELYSNGYIVFARPLYNKQVYNNLTTSTVEVPNGYLNDIPINQKEILSKTNVTLIEENNEIRKNIYENLFVNFTYYLSVIDEDTSTVYPSTANYINRNINVGNEENYNSTKMTKLRINYQDYSVMQNITWEMIDLTHFQTSVAIDTTEVPMSMDFMSNDESTVYLTKELDLDQGKCYVLTQKIRIE